MSRAKPLSDWRCEAKVEVEGKEKGRIRNIVPKGLLWRNGGMRECGVRMLGARYVKEKISPEGDFT
jgi:hypothetical protein